MSRERTTPKFLRDIEHDGSILKRIEEIQREENRAATAQAIVTQPESPYAGYYRDQLGIEEVTGRPAIIDYLDTLLNRSAGSVHDI